MKVREGIARPFFRTLRQEADALIVEIGAPAYAGLLIEHDFGPKTQAEIVQDMRDREEMK